jgi:hypothetical protein
VAEAGEGVRQVEGHGAGLVDEPSVEEGVDERPEARPGDLTAVVLFDLKVRGFDLGHGGVAEVEVEALEALGGLAAVGGPFPGSHDVVLWESETLTRTLVITCVSCELLC